MMNTLALKMDGKVVDCFENILGDSALLDNEDDPHEESGLLQLNVVNTEPSTSLAKCSQPKHQLNKKEREKLTQDLKTVSGELLLKRIVGHLSQEPRMQQYHEREELMI